MGLHEHSDPFCDTVIMTSVSFCKVLYTFLECTTTPGSAIWYTWVKFPFFKTHRYWLILLLCYICMGMHNWVYTCSLTDKADRGKIYTKENSNWLVYMLSCLSGTQIIGGFNQLTETIGWFDGGRKSKTLTFQV